MKLNYREFLMSDLLVVFRPEDVEMEAKEFMSTFASYMQGAGLVGKRPDGHTIYPSRTAPVDEEHSKFFDDWVTLADALELNSALSMDFYTDAWFGRDPKYQTVNARGNAMSHQICPNREEFWQYGAEIVKEMGSYPVNEILLFGTGFIRDQFCFCDRCRNEFAPMVNQEPERLSYQYIIENPDYHSKWHSWRTDKVMQGITYLQDAARDADEMVGRENPLRITVEILMDPETGLAEGGKNEYGYDYSRINDITGNLLINLYPWSPLLPGKGSKEYSELVESLYFVKEFERRGGHVSLFRWGVSEMGQVQEMKAIAQDAGISRLITSFHYPADYSTRREAAIGNY